MLTQNVPCGDPDYFRLILKESRNGSSPANPAGITLCKRTFTIVRELSSSNGVSLSAPGLPSEGTDLNLHKDLTLTYCAFPGNFP